MSSFFISHWNANCLLCKTEMFCYNIDEVYTALTTGNFTQRNKETIVCSHKATKLPVWEHLLIWDQVCHPCSASHLVLCPDKEQWALFQAHQWSHPSLMHIFRTGSSVSCMPSYLKQEDTGSFFFSLNVFSLHCGIGIEAAGTAWNDHGSGAGHVGSTAAAQHHLVNLFFTKLLGENSWTVFTDL